MYKILVCDPALQYGIETLFPAYSITVAQHSDEIIDLTYENHHDLYIVNFIYFETIRLLKEHGDETSTLFIDDYYDIMHVKQAFSVGDDYLLKPLAYEELKIRVNYHYQKLSCCKNDIIIYELFYYHTRTKQLYHGTSSVKLSPSETILIALFLMHKNKPLAKYILLDSLNSNSEGSLRVYISRLKKLGFNISYSWSQASYILFEEKEE